MSKGGGRTVPAILVAFGLGQLGLASVCMTIAPGIAAFIKIDCTPLLVSGIVFVVIGILLFVFFGEHGGGL